MPEINDWAPHICDGSTTLEKLAQEGYFFNDHEGVQATIEGLIYEISMVGSYPAMAAVHGRHVVVGVDQWWGVWVEGGFEPKRLERPERFKTSSEMNVEERLRRTKEWCETPEYLAWAEEAKDPRYTFKTYIQGDTLELALTETLKRWVARWEELRGERYEF